MGMSTGRDEALASCMVSVGCGNGLHTDSNGDKVETRSRIK